MDLQAAPVSEKAHGVVAATVETMQEEPTPSHDVYGHLPKPEENDKASSADMGVPPMWPLIHKHSNLAAHSVIMSPHP